MVRVSDKAKRGSNANTTGWAIASRQYLLQNWRADVVRATDSSGTITDRIRYTAYGEPQRYSLFDVGRQSGNIPDGSFDYDDYVAFLESLAIGDASVDPAADVDHDGTIDGADYTAFTNAYASDDEGPLGTGHLSRELDAGFRRGYAGYEFDPVLGASSASIYHVRNRVYDAENGRWSRRDPLGYVDGLGLYQYCQGRAQEMVDPSGLAKICRLPLQAAPGLFNLPNLRPAWWNRIPELSICVDAYNLTKDGLDAWNESVGPALNIGTYHWHICFEDGIDPSNWGFFGDGPQKGDDTEYCRNPRAICTGGYDDATLRRCKSECDKKPNFCTPGSYKLIGNNCQDYGECIMDCYTKLFVGPPAPPNRTRVSPTGTP